MVMQSLIWCSGLLLVGTVALGGIPAHAVVLENLGDAPDIALAIDVNSPPPECDQLVERLENLRDKMVEHNDGVNSFLGDVTNKLREWFDQLVPLEESRAEIPSGTFLVLQDGADKVDTITGMSYDNSDVLVGEMTKIIEGVRACQNP